MRGLIRPDRLDRACQRLGEVVVNPAAWPDVMADICNAAGATGAALLQFDSRTSDVPRAESIAEGVKYYFDNGWHTRVRAQKGAPLFLSGQQIIADQSFMTRESIASDAFYNECLLPFGMPWFAAIGFLADRDRWALSIQRSNQQGMFEKTELRLLEKLSCRLTEAATLSTAVGRAVLSSATSALNTVKMAAIALDRYGVVIDANAAAGTLFDEHIRISARRLLLQDSKSRRNYEAFLGHLRVAAENAPLAVEPIVVGRGEKRPIILRILSVPSEAASPFLGASALLLLQSLDTRPAQNPSLLMKAFNLTQAEAKVAMLVSDGSSPKAIAHALNLSRETIRNQLKAIFAKTNTHRQSELVALILRSNL